MREFHERYHEEFIDVFPKVKQHPAFYVNKLHEEADEVLEHVDPDIPVTQELLDEQADILITWLGLIHSSGISYHVALEAADHKLDQLIQRAEYASEQVVFRDGWNQHKKLPPTREDGS